MAKTKTGTWTHVALITAVACFLMGGIYGFGSNGQTVEAKTEAKPKVPVPRPEYIPPSELRSTRLLASPSSKSEEERYLGELELEGFKNPQPGTTDSEPDGRRGRDVATLDGFGKLERSLQRLSNVLRKLPDYLR